jgi:hypothetical protein
VSARSRTHRRAAGTGTLAVALVQSRPARYAPGSRTVKFFHTTVLR